MFERMLLTNTGGAKAPEVIRGPLWDPVELTGVISNGTVRASDGGVDWYGEVPSSELINGVNLASLIGLTAGTSQYANSGWLHVGLDGTELYVSKFSLRRSLIWNNINLANAVYGNRVVRISGVDYKIRLLKGANSDPTGQTISDQTDSPFSHGSEFNRIFYRLTSDNSNQTSEEPFLNLANYSDSELGFLNTTSLGSLTFCQERTGTMVLTRGWSRVTLSALKGLSVNSTHHGWRPVLERV